MRTLHQLEVGQVAVVDRVALRQSLMQVLVASRHAVQPPVLHTRLLVSEAAGVSLGLQAVFRKCV